MESRSSPSERSPSGPAVSSLLEARIAAESLALRRGSPVEGDLPPNLLRSGEARLLSAVRCRISCAQARLAYAPGRRANPRAWRSGLSSEKGRPAGDARLGARNLGQIRPADRLRRCPFTTTVRAAPG